MRGKIRREGKFPLEETPASGIPIKISFTAQDMGEDKPDAGFVDPISADKIGPGRKSRRVIVFPKRMCYTEKMGASLNKFNGENAV